MEVIRQVEQERQAARIEEKRHDHPKAMATKCGLKDTFHQGHCRRSVPRNGLRFLREERCGVAVTSVMALSQPVSQAQCQ